MFLVEHILKEYQFLLQKNVWSSIQTQVWILEEKKKKKRDTSLDIRRENKKKRDKSGY